MNYFKPTPYTKTCLLFGCLFSFKVLVLDTPTVAHAEESGYLYEVDNSAFETKPVDPFNPTVNVEPVPPVYTPDQKVEESTKRSYSTSPPNGKVPILLNKNKKQFKNVTNKVDPLLNQNTLVLTLNSGGNDFGGDDPNMLYLEELYTVLAGNLLYGEEASGMGDI
ncbi:hypothetical protein [Carnobacterium divergens]|uniref:hypothetical protein n=1 Tax=Carnobacterium divergens TaxID=2748 RepID=UPI0005559500|nr:hypothetical protein [Carnobacterium divergens]MDO0874630.1 hypothetical protein [Carnobacterium divergens]SUX22675.1 Uncharacterised protein [Carnobacterium divergens]